MEDREEQLRQRAYGIWQSEGEPHGRDRDHWEQAERELTEVVPDEPAAPAKPATRRKKADAAPQTIAAEPKPKAPRKPRAKTA
ncbi:DUF2934 domain-containing protein [Sphingomonas yabuuchiae]|uniref:DUF2934 domain-containing protein n=1 Tax=Sphingomonas yabuuchiae TaxID=172044 RepID=A0AA41A2E1_9SPHN|nr:DUF2934 domain-containing protein [Sphingomonas yabuuchiae]MBB4608705.1 hypothetical protein [Sphingomonas yabuuchiae]MBN3559021.1 DUF2934 domain-containing protein [Sphingomonas yabuuchiae]